MIDTKKGVVGKIDDMTLKEAARVSEVFVEKGVRFFIKTSYLFICDDESKLDEIVDELHLRGVSKDLEVIGGASQQCEEPIQFY